MEYSSRLFRMQHLLSQDLIAISDRKSRLLDFQVGRMLLLYLYGLMLAPLYPPLAEEIYSDCTSYYVARPKIAPSHLPSFLSAVSFQVLFVFLPVASDEELGIPEHEKFAQHH